MSKQSLSEKPLSERSLEISQFMDQKTPFKELPNSQWRQWIQESRRHPGDLQLRSFLLNGLWDIQQFREVLDLLPPLQDESLEIGLKWRTQVLFRLAFAGSSYVKRLIPAVVSYSHYLKELESNALLHLLNDLVQSREDKTLCQYHQLVLSVSKEVRKSLQSLQIPLSSRLFLSPEIAARLGPGPCDEIYTLLKRSESPAANYYASGGHHLLLALGGFFSEVPSQERKLISEEVSFQLDLMNAFRSLKKISQQLKPHQKYLAETPSAQLFLANHVRHFIQELRTGENQLPDKIQDKEVAKALAEVCEYLTELSEFISKKADDRLLFLDLADLEAHLFYFERTKVKLSIPLLSALLETAETLSKKQLPPEYLTELATAKIKIEELFVKHCLQKSDLENLSRFLKPKKKNENKNEIMNLCLDYIDQIIQECLSVSPQLKFLDKAEFCLQVLTNFKSQKQRQKILNTIIKVLHEKKGY